jgi:hypothetical protein|tara:strand:- start:711 stop:818 length:108 start_codon:yes stop_codon:yes gene_type:complete
LKARKAAQELAEKQKIEAAVAAEAKKKEEEEEKAK